MGGGGATVLDEMVAQGVSRSSGDASELMKPSVLEFEHCREGSRHT